MGMIGERVVRTEDPALVTGRATYVDNLVVEGAVHVVYVRSTVAHARLVSIDTSDARSMPGVIGVFTHADLVADGIGPLPIDMPLLPADVRRTALADGTVRFVGELVAAVVAEARAEAIDAAEAVLVDYEPLDVVIDPVAAMESSTLLFPEHGSNVVVTLPALGPIDFSDCDVVLEKRIVNQRLAPSPLEMRVAVSRWEEPDESGVRRLTHWQATQGAHPIRNQICDFYGLPAEQVRVITPDVGGGFGAKAFFYPEDLLVPWLARRVDRPVRYTESRTESMNGLGHGRGQIQDVKIGGTRDGRILAYEVRVVQDAGAYPRFGAFLPFMTGRMLTGTYDIPRAAMTAYGVLTNTVPTVAYRGAGRPEAAAAIERAVDMFAREIGLDPAEVRRRNLVAPDRFPYTTAMGTTYDSGDYPGALELALQAADYPALRAEQERRRANDDPVQLGIGIAVYVEITAMSGGSELGTIDVTADADGRPCARIVTGTTPYGQGHRTTWAMLAADRLGIPFENITVVHGDTDLVRSGEITGGSRSVQLGGTNVWRAAGEAADKARTVAAQLLEADVSDVVLENGKFFVVGSPAVSKQWSDVLAEAARRDESIDGEGDFAQAGGTFPSGAHVAVVEVDTETGKVKLRDVFAADDAGRIVNPLLAEGQIHGGLVQGIGQALFEEVIYDADGNPLTGNFADYGFPSSAEVPSFVTVHLASPSPLNDLGAKGIGESGTIGATPAVQNAVVDALAPFGVDHVDLPCTPHRVWAAITTTR
ncbi:MAG: xanthine dehydrogenase family protein molybdopterin-binding subunit [Actinobacteria bacterium]|nr:xanthine dehydrogenase family protein molybdopterin-binding subunit [Actinomycetota bacterium]